MRSICAKFAITVGAFAVAFSALVLWYSWHSSHTYLEEVISRRAALALEFDLAIREYVAKAVRPQMEARVGEGEFLPETMSTSFVARSVFDRVRRKYPEYLLKFSSDDPRNPANRAGPAEMEVLEYFRTHPEAKRWAGIIEIDGKEYAAHFSPRRMRRSCLRCHGRPEDAPRSLVKRYGPRAGFHRSVGDLIAMDTVAMPTDQVQAALRRQLGRNLLAIGIWLVCLFGAVLLVFRWTVGRRLSAIAKHFAERADDENEGPPLAPIPVRGRDEIGALVAGYGIDAPGRPALGVLALFAKQPISADDAAALEGLRSTLALEERIIACCFWEMGCSAHEGGTFAMNRAIQVVLKTLGIVFLTVLSGGVCFVVSVLVLMQLGLHYHGNYEYYGDYPILFLGRSASAGRRTRAGRLRAGVAAPPAPSRADAFGGPPRASPWAK